MSNDNTNSLSPQSSQLPLFPQPRTCVIDGEIHVSIIDVYRIYGKAKRPDQDWRRDKIELINQGYNLSNLNVYQFEGADGKFHKPTPVVNEEQLARIIQVTRSREWESHRQEMAYLFAHRRDIKPTKPFESTKRYKELRRSGLTHDEALERDDVDRLGKDTYKEITSEWHRRDGSIPVLANHTMRLVTGKSATALKRELRITVSPRAYIPTPDRAKLTVVESFGAILHRKRNSQGTEALERDLNDASEIIDHDKLEEVFNRKPILPPDPKPIHRRLPRG